MPLILLIKQENNIKQEKCEEKSTFGGWLELRLMMSSSVTRFALDP